MSVQCQDSEPSDTQTQGLFLNAPCAQQGHTSFLSHAPEFLPLYDPSDWSLVPSDSPVCTPTTPTDRVSPILLCSIFSYPFCCVGHGAWRDVTLFKLAVWAVQGRDCMPGLTTEHRLMDSQRQAKLIHVLVMTDDLLP
ncbi:hypothetical protein E2C01_005166 [Portunus trituberculatus]|uniref:Uncharacterized protein n=1 Tax=Portunus trituberculatus TaxID=210409 RepID=A0A5B7CTJ0_PORTR|nr:hypothetical protein [Portunus trituberculatus]